MILMSFSHQQQQKLFVENAKENQSRLLMVAVRCAHSARSITNLAQVITDAILHLENVFMARSNRVITNLDLNFNGKGHYKRLQKLDVASRLTSKQ
jgi:uncharacterized protein YpiB (UPF0302 family)